MLLADQGKGEAASGRQTTWYVNEAFESLRRQEKKIKEKGLALRKPQNSGLVTQWKA